MLLENKVAVIYGGGGAIGAAAARAFAREGAQVFLAGRTPEKMEAVAADIRAKGGVVETAVLDALDQKAVEAFLAGVVHQAGRIDISFNVIGVGDVQRPLMDLAVEEFLQPIAVTTRTQFITTRAAAAYMICQGSGVILTYGGGGPQTLPGLGGFKVALDAMESLRRQWACELGEHGIRVITLKTGGIPEFDPRISPRARGDHRQHPAVNPAEAGSDPGRRGQCGGLCRLRSGAHDHRDGDQYLLRSADGLGII